MNIPFSIPRVSELNALPHGDRVSVMSRYASSPEAKRAIWTLKALLFLALVFAVLGLGFLQLHSPPPLIRWGESKLSILLWLLSGLAMIVAVASYRVIAERTIRRILTEPISKPRS